MYPTHLALGGDRFGFITMTRRFTIQSTTGPIKDILNTNIYRSLRSTTHESRTIFHILIVFLFLIILFSLYGF